MSDDPTESDVAEQPPPAPVLIVQADGAIVVGAGYTVGDVLRALQAAETFVLGLRFG